MQTRLFHIFFFCKLLLVFGQAKATDDSRLIRWLLNQQADSLGPIAKNAAKYHLQIIFTHIERRQGKPPLLKRYLYTAPGNPFFYPASLVKLPVCALSLEKINSLSAYGIDANTPMCTDSAGMCQRKILWDSTNVDGYMPSVAHYIRRMLLVSDNFSYSRLYEWCNPFFLQKRLKTMGYPAARIVHRFDAECTPLANAVTNPVYFFSPSRDTLFKQSLHSPYRIPPHPLKYPLLGKFSIDDKGRKIRRPKNFSRMNYLPLQDIDQMVKALVMPEALPPSQRFMITEEQRKFLLDYMQMWPRESSNPVYPDSLYEDSYKKYLFYGDTHGKIASDSVRIYNIVGQSYGNLADCAYLVNQERGIEFFLSAVIYVNSDNVVNDGKYDYKSLGFPFLQQLGRMFYRYEWKLKQQTSGK